MFWQENYKSQTSPPPYQEKVWDERGRSVKYKMVIVGVTLTLTRAGGKLL